MQMGMKILKITKALYGDCSTGFGIDIGYALSQIQVQHFPGAATQFCQKAAAEKTFEDKIYSRLLEY